MKILFFIQDLGMGGVVRQISILSEHLARRGHDVSVLALYSTDQNWKLIWKLDSIDVQSLLIQNPTGVLSAGVKLIKATLKLRNLLKRGNIQILYSYQGHITRFISWLATRGMASTKLIWGIQGSGQRSALYNNWKVSLPFHLCRWVSVSVPLMIANSEAGYARYKANGYRCLRRLVINNGFDANKFKSDPESRARVRSEWKIENELLIGVVARLSSEKGHRTFLEAAALLAKERRNVRFVIVGDGDKPYRDQLQFLSQKLDLTEFIIWAGFREDMPAVYNALDILCSSSSREGFTNVIGEAMACGVPCVVTDVGDSAKIVGDKGIVVPRANPQMLANGLRTMLLKLSDIKPYQIRDRIVKHFTIENMVDKTEKILIETYGGVK
jgi:glycosyltransferase involved in cell wall biosynthesis